MILEDFFTLSEMKDGLGTSNRVKELITVMREQKDCNASDITDSFRQWSTVAKILTVTENKDCLECFIQFDGVWYLNYWLQEAQTPESYESDDSACKLINYILGALDKLPVNKEILVSSGIGLTLKQVICETNTFLKDKGRKFLDKWEFMGDEVKDQGLVKLEALHIVELKTNASLMVDGVQATKVTNPLHNIPSDKLVEGGVCGSDSIEKFDQMDGIMHQVTLEIGGAVNMDTSVSNRHIQQSTSNSGGVPVVSGDVNSLASSNVSNPCQEGISIADESSACAVTRMSDTSNLFVMEKAVNGRSDFSDIKDTSNILNDAEVHMPKTETNSLKSKPKEESIVISCLEVSSSMWNLVPLSSVPCTSGSKETKNSWTNVSEPEMEKGTVDERLQTSSQKSDAQPETTCGDLCGETSNNMKNTGNSILKAAKETDSRNRYGYGSISARKAEMELEFGDDALEVAVQVAIEAEREVADRERCSSSHEEKSNGEVVDSGCSSPEAHKTDQANSCAYPSISEHLDGDSSPGKNSSRTSGVEIGQTTRVRDSESPLSTSVIPVSLENAKENVCSFDLNEGMDSEDADHSLPDSPSLPARQNLSAPIAVVATTKGSPGFPIMRPPFNGESGWRGSAATSAFRPASPQKGLDCQQVSSNNEKGNLLEFDLNEADHENNVAADSMFIKPSHLSELNVPNHENNAAADSMLIKPSHLSELISHNSPIEVSSQRNERIVLDLNCPGVEDVNFRDQNTENINGSHLSHLSLLTKHTPFRDIDLNDSPAAFDVSDLQSSNKSCLKASPASESGDLGDPDVVILGSRMPTVWRDPFNHSWHSSVRGLHMDTPIGVRASSMVYPYMPANSYGYNGVGMGPNAMPLHLRPHGPGFLPYMVDSRGTTVIPQVLSPSTGFVGPPALMPFPIGAASNPVGLGIASSSVLGVLGSPKPPLDLNSGTFSFDSSTREYGSFGKPYVQGRNSWTEEQVKQSPQSVSSSGMGLKRKEPDPNWDSHTIAYKQMRPWH